MNSYIEKYCGLWESESGNRLEVSLSNNETVSVKLYRAGEVKPMSRPWLNNSPAVNMVGKLDPEGGSLDIALSEYENSFSLNLVFDLSDRNYKKVLPSIIRYEKDHFWEQYYDCIGPLEPYQRC